NLKPHERRDLVTLPATFLEEVERARENQRRGDLRLLAQEVRSFEWDQEGLREIGEAQFALKANAGAKETFQLLRASAPDDLRANQRLGTIYQRLAYNDASKQKEDCLVRSDQAVSRALRASSRPGDRAEALSLLASNEKSRWIREYQTVGPELRRSTALRSAHLSKMIGHYLDAVREDLNAYDPAVNALGLLKAQIELAQSLPADWSSLFASDAEAQNDLANRTRLADRIAASVSLALGVDDGGGRNSADPWAESSR